MLAFALALGLFLFWSVVGYATIWCCSRRNLIQNALLAAPVGLALTVIIMLWANRIGFPLRTCGPPLTIALLLSAITVLRVKRAILPIRRLLLFAVVVLVSALATGYPALIFGFNWVSYTNDDMANYCLSAKLFLNHGMLDTPDWQKLLQNADASQTSWYLEVLTGMRAGAEELLAWVASISGLTAHQIFMPTILALQLALVTAAGAMVCRSKASRPSAILTCLWTGLSALVALGTIYQLIAQVLGLAILGALTALLASVTRLGSGKWLTRQIFLMGAVGSALCLSYPEITPFAVVAVIAAVIITWKRHREVLVPTCKQVLKSLLLCLALCCVFLPGVISTLAEQIVNGTGSARVGASLFPYYLMPSGFAYIWGFHNIGGPLDTTGINMAVAAGFVLFVLALVGAAMMTVSGEMVSAVFAAMTVLAVKLFVGRSDFGLFKIAMYCQPFLIASTIVAWQTFVSRRIRISTRTRRIIGAAPVLLLVAGGLRGQTAYTIRSTGIYGSGFLEIPRPSDHAILEQLQPLARPHAGVAFLSDTNNVVLQKFEAYYTTGTPLFTPAIDFFGSRLGAYPVGVYRRFLGIIQPGIEEKARKVSGQKAAANWTGGFDTRGARPRTNTFDLVDRVDEIARGNFLLLASGPNQQKFNGRKFAGLSSRTEVTVIPSEHVQNHLVEVPSYYGAGYYSVLGRSEGRVAVYQPESDPFFSDSTISAIGRDVLFQVIKSKDRPRMVVEYTATFAGDGSNKVPTLSVVGSTREYFGEVGRGSVRLVSAPVSPQHIRNGDYMMFDTGGIPKLFPDHRWGLMKLYGMEFPEDPRSVSGFIRDISLISEEEYHNLKAPEHLSSFPSDLSNKNLQYSGFYEDGWVGEAAMAILSQPVAARACLAVQMTVPNRFGQPLSTSVITSLDGIQIDQRALHGGTASFCLPVSNEPGDHRVNLTFDRATPLAPPDTRPASAMVQFLGFRAVAEPVTGGAMPQPNTEQIRIPSNATR